jgi:hypothetical protein
MSSPLQRMERKEDEAQIWLELYAAACKVMRAGSNQKASHAAKIEMDKVLSRLRKAPGR